MAADISLDLRWLLDNLPDGVIFLDRAWRVTYANVQARAISRIRPEDLNGPTHWELWPATVDTEQHRKYLRVMEERVEEDLEFYYPPFRIWVQLRAIPITTGIAVIYRDVTAMREAQDTAYKLGVQLAQVFDATSDGIAVLNREWRYTFLNRRAKEILRPFGQDLVGMNVWNAFPDSVYDGSPYVECFYRTMNERVPTLFEAWYPAPLNLFLRVEAQSAPDGIVILFRDITQDRRDADLLKAEKLETERQRAELEAVYRTAPVGLALFEPKEFRYLRVNDRQSEILGLPPDEIIGTRVEDIVVSPIVPQLFREKVLRGEYVRDCVYETALYARPGEIRSFNVNYSPVFDEEGDVRAISAAVLEVTQLRRAEQALLQSEKLAAVGRLASSISHEINNPLEAVTNLLYLLEAVPGLPQEARSYILLAQDELARVSQIATQTLRFHRQANKPTQVTAAQLVDAVLNLFAGRLMNSGIHVEASYGTARPVLCFENDIRQILNNLISNAIDAMRTGGRLIVRAHDAVDRERGEPGVRIIIADTGTGMSSETRARLFEPFYTTKDLNGNGLGLWISKEIVERHKGRLTLRSSQHPQFHGTVFSLFLPCRPAQEPGTGAVA
jgi:PAS domain S-box-containing protein